MGAKVSLWVYVIGGGVAGPELCTCLCVCSVTCAGWLGKGTQLTGEPDRNLRRVAVHECFLFPLLRGKSVEGREGLDLLYLHISGDVFHTEARRSSRGKEPI